MDSKGMILEQAILRALNRLYDNDGYLIRHNLHEQCISFRFGLYLYNELKYNHFADYDFDAEYNRNKDDKKFLPSWKDGARPDFILHKRGKTTGDNILIIEIKKGIKPRVTKADKQKILEFMNYPYYYEYGITILLTPSRWQIEWIDKN